MAARESTVRFLNGKRILLSSATQDQSDVFWNYVRHWTVDLPGLYKNESRRILQWRNGEIKVKTGSDPDVFRSDYRDLIVFDEAALLDRRVWYEVGLPMLADTQGDAWFLSTPKRRNWFFELFIHAQSESDPEWAAWNAPTHANPHMKPESIKRLAQNMTADEYNQEILAQFLEGQGVVFRRVAEVARLAPVQPIADHHYVMGVDWAQKNDYTVLVVLDETTREMVALDRFNGIDWALQRGRLAALYERWQPRVIMAESNSIGSPNIEALQREGLPVRAFETTAVSKPPLIESLVLAFERDELAVLNDAVLKGEFMAYERKVSPVTGRSQYSAPEGGHDDTVMATALAWWGIQRARLAMPIFFS